MPSNGRVPLSEVSPEKNPQVSFWKEKFTWKESLRITENLCKAGYQKSAAKKLNYLAEEAYI